jgi:drug/metabolite transporter (DMT)-like permease
MHFGVVATSLLVSFLWGAAPVIHKFLMSTRPISPETLMVFGSMVYFSCVVVYFYFNHKPIIADLKQASITTLSIMFVSAMFAGFLANLLYFRVIKEHASYVVSALIFSSPFFTLLLSYIFLKEKMSLKSISGVVCIVVGVILLATSNEVKTEKIANRVLAD